MSKTVTVYQYPRCSTCRKALKWLEDRSYEVNSVHIVEQPPAEDELKRLIDLSGLPIKSFFNTSGKVYREQNLKEQIPNMTEDQLIRLLASNGMLIKRPIVTDGAKVTVGFSEQTFDSVWG